jgi:hypothetical protein
LKDAGASSAPATSIEESEMAQSKNIAVAQKWNLLNWREYQSWKSLLAAGILLSLLGGVAIRHSYAMYVEASGLIVKLTPSVQPKEASAELKSPPKTLVEQRQRELEADLLMHHAERTEKYVNELKAVFPDVYNAKGKMYQSIAVDDAVKALDEPSIASAMRHLFSYYESLGRYYLSGAVDREAFEEDWKLVFIKVHVAYKNVLGELVKRCHCEYPGLETVGSLWAKGESSIETQPHWPKPGS